MIITVVVESTFSGQAGGFHHITIDDSQLVQELISQYCTAKGAPQNPNYTLMNKGNSLLDSKRPISASYVKDGDVLKLITMSKKGSRFAFAHWLTMAAIGMFVGILGLTVCVLLYAVFRNVPDNYAMVIDAGSTHTDMILYSWPGTKRNNTGEVTQINLCSASGGIAEVSPNNVDKYFDTCFEQSYEKIKEESRKNAEVLFGATAGMRLLNQSNPTKATAVISSVKSYLQKTGWEFKDANVGIIEGSTEGVSGWITSNFLEQTVLTKGSVNTTFGAMDLGGASTQISFEVPDSFKDSPNVHPLSLFGNKFYVYSQSYMCHGVVQSLRRYRTVLIVEQRKPGEPAGEIVSPCEPNGTVIPLNSSYFSAGCVNTEVLEPHKDVESWNLVGTGDYSECQRVLSKLLNFEKCTEMNLGYCADASMMPPQRLHQRYYAFAAYAYITTDLRLPPGSTKADAEQYIKVMCALSNIQLIEVKANSKNRKRNFNTLCFEAQYMYTLLVDLYGFDTNESWGQITFTNQARETTLGWSLGYMVNATEEIAAGPPIPKLKVLPFSLLTVLFIIFVLLSIGFSVHGYKVRKNSTDYQRKLVKLMDHELEKFLQPEEYDQTD